MSPPSFKLTSVNLQNSVASTTLNLQTPHIGFPRIVILLLRWTHKLWCHVQQGPQHVHLQLLPLVTSQPRHVYRKAEVSEFHRLLLVADEDVGRLDVSATTHTLVSGPVVLVSGPVVPALHISLKFDNKFQTDQVI